MVIAAMKLKDACSLEEKLVKAQEREKRKETRHAQMLAALPGSPIANPVSLKDKA